MIKTKKEKVREVRSLTNDENREEMKALSIAIAIGGKGNCVIDSAFDVAIKNSYVPSEPFQRLVRNNFKKLSNDFIFLGYIFEPNEKYYANWKSNKLYIYVPSKNMIYSKPFTNIF